MSDPVDPWLRLKEMLAVVEHQYSARQERDAKVRRVLTADEALHVDQAIREVQRAMRHARLTVRQVHDPLEIVGMGEDADLLRRRLDRVSEALREVRLTWKARNPY